MVEVRLDFRVAEKDANARGKRARDSLLQSCDIAGWNVGNVGRFDLGEEIAEGNDCVLSGGIADVEERIVNGAACLRKRGGNECESSAGCVERGHGLGGEVTAGGGIYFLEEDAPWRIAEEFRDLGDAIECLLSW